MLLRASLRAQAVTVSEHLHHTPLYHIPRDVYTQALCVAILVLTSKIYLETCLCALPEYVSSAVQRSLLYL